MCVCVCVCVCVGTARRRTLRHPPVMGEGCHHSVAGHHAGHHRGTFFLYVLYHLSSHVLISVYLFLLLVLHVSPLNLLQTFIAAICSFPLPHTLFTPLQFSLRKDVPSQIIISPTSRTECLLSPFTPSSPAWPSFIYLSLRTQAAAAFSFTRTDSAEQHVQKRTVSPTRQSTSTRAGETDNTQRAILQIAIQYVSSETMRALYHCQQAATFPLCPLA